MPILEIITPPDSINTSEAVALTTSFKLYLNVPAAQTEDDTLILTNLYGGRTFIENATGRVMIQTVFREYFDGWPCTQQGQPARIIELSRGPVSAIASVQYLGEDGSTWHTLATTEYRTDIFSPLARIELASGSSWPTNDLYSGILSVRVQYTAGYASTAAQPVPLRGAAALLGGAFYRADKIEDAFAIARKYYEPYILKR